MANNLKSCALSARRLSGSPRQRERALNLYAREQAQTARVLELASKLRGFPRLERARLILLRVQAAGYRPDQVGGADRLQSVACTLDNGGDCVELSCAVVALALASGLPAWCVWIPQPQAPQDHVAARIGLGGRVYWAEASILGADLGEDPYRAAARLATRVPS